LVEDYSGMTVNERLFVAGLLEAYDSAVQRSDEQALVDILAKVGLRRDAAGMNWELPSGANDAQD
jgi:hypothetical protein